MIKIKFTGFVCLECGQQLQTGVNLPVNEHQITIEPCNKCSVVSLNSLTECDRQTLNALLLRAGSHGLGNHSHLWERLRKKVGYNCESVHLCPDEERELQNYEILLLKYRELDRKFKTQQVVLSDYQDAESES